MLNATLSRAPRKARKPIVRAFAATLARVLLLRCPLLIPPALLAVCRPDLASFSLFVAVLYVAAAAVESYARAAMRPIPTRRLEESR